jgi:hypothetical protein
MTPAIRRYLFRYIAKRRAVALIGAIGWTTAFALGWLILFRSLNRWLPPNQWMDRSEWVLGFLACVAILGRPMSFLVRRFDAVAAAIEIESRHQVFDQRLITIASQPQNSALLTQLTSEVEQITAARKNRAAVPLRPLLAPVLALIAAVLLARAVRLDLSDLITRWISRPGK